MKRLLSRMKALDESKPIEITPQQLDGATRHHQGWLRQTLKTCPACGKNVVGHENAHFAMTIATEENQQRLRQFFNALKEHRWSDAQQFNEFDPVCDATDAEALKCTSGQIIMLYIRNPFELFENSRLISYDVLDLQNSKEVTMMIEPEKWRVIQ